MKVEYLNADDGYPIYTEEVENIIDIVSIYNTPNAKFNISFGDGHYVYGEFQEIIYNIEKNDNGKMEQILKVYIKVMLQK